MELLSRAVGPIATNVHVLADPATREAIAIDTAIPSLAWIGAELAARGWTLKLIVSTHGHWDHIGDNAALSAQTGAPIAVHPLDRERLVHPQPIAAPFEIPPSVPAVELAEGGTIRFGSLRLDVLHTPGHTEGSVCLLAPDDGLLFSGDTLFAGGWGRVDLPGGSAGADGRLDHPARPARPAAPGAAGPRTVHDDRARSGLDRARDRRRPPLRLSQRGSGRSAGASKPLRYLTVVSRPPEAEPLVDADGAGHVLGVRAQRGLGHAGRAQAVEGGDDQGRGQAAAAPGRRTLTWSSQPRRIPSTSFSAGQIEGITTPATSSPAQAIRHRPVSSSGSANQAS